MALKIYFAGSIRGGREDAALYRRLIGFLGDFGEVLTGHVGDNALLEAEKFMTESEIYQRDMAWLREADTVIAEVSTPSLGVGYEIAAAEATGKDIFCLFRAGRERPLSAMIGGCPALRVGNYRDAAEAEELLRDFFASVSTNDQGDR